MSNCPSCGSPASDGMLCTTESRLLARDLEQLPHLMRDLLITYTRQSQSGTGGGAKSAETALPFDGRASVVHDWVVNTVGTWIRVLSEGHNDVTTFIEVNGQQVEVSLAGTSMRSWCRWLAARLDRIRGHEAVNEIVRDFGSAVLRIKSVVDRPADRLFVTSCALCSDPIFAETEDDVDIECRRCLRVVQANGDLKGYVPKYDAKPHRDQMRADLLDSLATRFEITGVIPWIYQVEIKEGTFDSWVKRGRIVRAGSRSGVALFSVRDAVSLAQEAAVRPQGKRRSAS